MNKRGSVILHMLITGVVVALIAAMLLRLTMLRVMMTSRSHKAAQMKRYDEAALARIHSFWASAGGAPCANNVPGYSCAGTPGACNCTCTPASAGDPTVTVTGALPSCKLSIVSPDLSPAP